MKSKIYYSAFLRVTLVLSACASAVPAATAMPATAMPVTIAPVIPNTGQATDTPVATATMAPMATPTSPAAVNAAIMTTHSSGQVEGQINRLKLIKRMMYGHGNLDLLRKRVMFSLA